MENKEVICNDGTKDTYCVKDCPETLVAVPPPCENHGGVNPNPVLADEMKAKLTDTQKWAIIIGVSALAYYILYKTGAFE